MKISFWKHPVRYIRRLNTPRCSTCEHYRYSILPQSHLCNSPKYLERASRLAARDYCDSNVENVRGTRFCDYREREDEE